MYRFRFEGIENTSQYEELIKEFIQPNEYVIDREDVCVDETETIVDFAYSFKGDKEELKRKLYDDLAEHTNKRPRWGVLTGIRPVKLAGEILDRGESPDEILSTSYLVEDSKVKLTCDILDYQRRTIGKPHNDSFSLYVGIPFCPTRCLYCSFTSNQVNDDEMDRYLVALKKEIQYAGMKSNLERNVLESIYFGGGTPTSLSADQLDDLLETVRESFRTDFIKEFTVEAGRPDTIDSEKLNVLRYHGVDRISINPQTTKSSTLELIGRRHTVDDVYRAFEMAHKAGFSTINTDLIAGLPEETFDDFAHSVEEIISLGATNITLHTLAVKRASRLKEMDENFNYRDEVLREEMLDWAHKRLNEEGMKPYYLYRQKHTSGNTENTGFCKPDMVSTYNIRIMEEAQSILALGAGGISKKYYPAENRLERVANVSNYEIYIDRIDEMIERKNKGFFIKQEDEKC